MVAARPGGSSARPGHTGVNFDAKIEAGKASFKDLEAYMLKKGEAAPNTSGRQEFLENLLNEFI